MILTEPEIKRCLTKRIVNQTTHSRKFHSTLANLYFINYNAIFVFCYTHLVRKTIWLAFDAKYFKIELPEDALIEDQKCAYTSRIRYMP